MTGWGGGNPNIDEDTGGGGAPEKQCPFCPEVVRDLPGHIRREHDAE